MMVLAGCRYNKKALKAFPYPLTCTAIQFGIGSLMALTMWALRLHERPKLEEDTVGAVIVHQRAGNLMLPHPVCGCAKPCHPREQSRPVLVRAMWQALRRNSLVSGAAQKHQPIGAGALGRQHTHKRQPGPCGGVFHTYHQGGSGMPWRTAGFAV